MLPIMNLWVLHLHTQQTVRCRYWSRQFLNPTGLQCDRILQLSQRMNMAAEHTRGLAGAPCVPSNSVKAVKKRISTFCWILNAVFILSLLLLTTRQRVSIKYNVCAPSCGSQCLLYSTFLNNGRAKVPSTLHGNINPASKAVRLLHLVFMVLLAGDVEINPGPHPTNINYQANRGV